MLKYVCNKELLVLALMFIKLGLGKTLHILLAMIFEFQYPRLRKSGLMCVLNNALYMGVVSCIQVCIFLMHLILHLCFAISGNIWIRTGNN